MRWFPLALLVGCTEYDLARPPEPEDVGANDAPSPDADGTADETPATDTADEPTDDPPPPAEEEEDDDFWPDWWPDDWQDDTGSDEPSFDPWNFDLPIDESFPDPTADLYVNDASNLYTYDVSSNALSWVGTFSERGTGQACNWMVDIAIDLDGHLFGTCGTELVQIDPTNGTFVRALSMDQEYVGLTFLSNGKLVLAGNGEVRIWNPTTNAVSVLNDGMDYVTSGDLVGLPDGKLYWTVTGGDDLVRLDPSTGSTSWIGATSSNWAYEIWGVAWAEGQLFGFTSDGKVLRMDGANAQVTVRATHDTAFYGATANPVAW